MRSLYNMPQPVSLPNILLHSHLACILSIGFNNTATIQSSLQKGKNI